MVCLYTYTYSYHVVQTKTRYSLLPIYALTFEAKKIRILEIRIKCVGSYKTGCLTVDNVNLEGEKNSQ